MPITLTKPSLRAQILAARSGMTHAQLKAAANALFVSLLALLDGYEFRTLACYVPRGSEPGGPELPERLATAFPSATILLPVLLPDLDLDWAAYNGTSSLALTPRRLLEPTTPRLGPDAIAAADVIIVPALAVDRSGHRLGRGGGSYDRALARARPDAVTIALLHHGELVPDVPHDARDIRVTGWLAP